MVGLISCALGVICYVNGVTIYIGNFYGLFVVGIILCVLRVNCVLGVLCVNGVTGEVVWVFSCV